MSNEHLLRSKDVRSRPRPSDLNHFAGPFTLYLAYKTSKSPESDDFKEKALEIVSEYKNVGFLMLVDLPGPGILH